MNLFVIRETIDFCVEINKFNPADSENVSKNAFKDA